LHFLRFSTHPLAESTAALGLKPQQTASIPIPRMHIRPAISHDAEAISALIRSVAHYFTLHPQGQGTEEFLKTITGEAIDGLIHAAHFRYFAGFMGDDLAGVVAIRDDKHLYHLFVSPQFQRQGLASQLWAHAKADALRRGNPGEFTVNSSPFAVPVYAAFGFVPVGDKVETHGIAFVPMKLSDPFPAV